MEGSISCESLIADITASNFFKDNPQIIDKPSIYRWVSLALKRFGTNIMQKKEKIIKIKNYRGNVGIDYAQLSLALLCEPCYYTTNKCAKTHLIDTYFFKERIEKECIPEKDCNDICETPSSEKHITERYYFNEGCEVQLYYKNPIYVTLGDDILRDSCADDCRNRHNYDKRYSMNIKGQTVYTNFKEGVIYLVYYALPIDDDGVPLIPNTNLGYLETYIEYHIKRKILEDAILSDDAPNKITLYREFKIEEREQLDNALTDTSPIDMKSLWLAIDKKRSDIYKYDLVI